MRGKRFTKIILIILIIISGFLYVCSDHCRISIYGIPYIDDDIHHYYKEAYTLNEDINFSIDLKNMSDFVGDVVYSKDQCTISIHDIQYCNGNYEITFRSNGYYSYNTAILVSGIRHIRKENEEGIDIEGILEIEYENKVYRCAVKGGTGISYKDGDAFGFYIFPNEIFENEHLGNIGMLNLTLSNLTYHIWTRR